MAPDAPACEGECRASSSEWSRDSLRSASTSSSSAGSARSLQGAPVVTQDLDVCYRRSPENIARLARAIAPFRPRLRGIPADLPAAVDEHTLRQGTNFTLELEGEALDLLGEMSGVGGYEEVVSRAVTLDLGEVAVQVLALDDLIASKRAAGRSKDLAALPVLEETRQLLAERRDSRE